MLSPAREPFRGSCGPRRTERVPCPRKPPCFGALSIGRRGTQPATHLAYKKACTFTEQRGGDRSENPVRTQASTRRRHVVGAPTDVSGAERQRVLRAPGVDIQGRLGCAVGAGGRMRRAAERTWCGCLR